MLSLIFATETAVPISATVPGDDLMTVALTMLGIVMLVTAIATWVVTPKGEHH